MLCSDFFSDVSLFWYASLSSIWLNTPLNILRLFHIGHLKLFWRLEKYSITETDILWYDLHEYICCYLSDLCIASPLVLWPSLTSIMKHQICMTHDLATAYRHDHAWTDEWTQNVSTLSRQMSLMRLRGERRQHGWTGHLYGMWGAWKILQLAMPYWMSVLWPSWGGRTFMS